MKAWASLQKPKEAHERNLKLLKAAGFVQEQLQDKSLAQGDFRVVCWRSSSVILESCSCIELATTTQLVLERRCEWG